MDHLPGRRQRLWEAMESCRNGTDELRDPQFADLASRLAEDPELRGQFRRLQEADGAIKAGFTNLPLPAGLAERVLRCLAEAAPTGSGERGAESGEQMAESSGSAPGALDSIAAAAVIASPVMAPDRPVPLPLPTGRFSRRRLLVGIAATSAAAALFAVVWIQSHLPRHETPTSVLEEAMDFFGKDSQPFGPSVSRVPPPADYPMSRDIARFQDIRWRYVEKFLGGPAVAYDLPTVGGRATLYVVRKNVPGLPSYPPDSPLSTGGMSAAAWQAGGTLYFLVVEGDAGTYSSYLDQSHGPLT